MRKFFASVLLVAGIAATASTQAATVDYVNPAPYEGVVGATLFEDVQFMQGSSGYVNKLGKVDAGWYQLTLTDFVFPTAFQDLRVAVTTATKVVSILDLKDGFNQAIGYLQLNDRDSYYLSVYGVTQSAGFALYGVQLAQFVASPVPLPASLVLLMSGLLAWGAAGMKRRTAA